MEANVDKRTPDQHALAYAENIIATLREPFLVLDKSLRVRTANASFLRDFHEQAGFCLFGGRFDVHRRHRLYQPRQQPRLDQRRLAAATWSVDEAH